MARPKSDDPKVAVTLRLPRSVVAGYEAAGKGWRQAMEARILRDDLASTSMRPRAAFKVQFGGARPVVAGLQLGASQPAYGERLKKR